MSEILQVITIEPPIALSYPSARIEVFKSSIRRCTVCNGQGGKYYDQHSLRGEGWIICPLCKGSGQIQANITHEWVSVGEPKEQFRTESEPK